MNYFDYPFTGKLYGAAFKRETLPFPNWLLFLIKYSIYSTYTKTLMMQWRL